MDAARVRVARPDGAPDGTTECERFLFYRGLGHANPAIHVTQHGDDGARVVIANREQAAIPAAFVVAMGAGPDGDAEDAARFAPLGAIEAGASAAHDLRSRPYVSRADAIEALSRLVREALAARGLYRDEAAAMVRTWAASWFGEPGTRVIYIVPPGFAERTLPLAITPAPDELIRVFVGRIEYMTPEDERAVAALVADAASSEPWRRRRAIRELAAHGRFLEPKLRRVEASAGDPAIRARATALLAELSPAR